MKIVFERRHPPREEAAILADRVAAHRRGAWRHVLAQEREHPLFDRRLVERRRLDLVDQARSRVRRLIPRVHAGQGRIVLMHDQHRRLGDGRQRRVGDDQRDLDDAVGFGLQARHFHVYPDQQIGVLRHYFHLA